PTRRRLVSNHSEALNHARSVGPWYLVLGSWSVLGPWFVPGPWSTRERTNQNIGYGPWDLGMRYRATHSTKYRYDATVSQCQSEVRLTPRALPWQALIESRIEATPGAASVEAHKDYFGNDVTTFTILESHDRFTVVATSVVDVQPRPVVHAAE